MNESGESEATARNIKIAHILDREGLNQTKKYTKDTWENNKKMRMEMHSMAFEGLSEQSAMITRSRQGEQMIQELQEVLGRFHTQVEDTNASGFCDIPLEYETRLKWFDTILAKAIEAKDLYKGALELASKNERSAVVVEIQKICRQFEGLMKVIHGKGNPECAERIKSQLGWFNDLIHATLNGKPIGQPRLA